VSSPSPLRACVNDSAETRCSDRVERARDQGCAGPGCLERGSERRTAGALAVEADGKTARLPQALDELPGLGRIERARGIVEKDARGAQLLETLRALEQHLGFAGETRAVHEPHGKLFLRCPNRLSGLPKVRKIVQRIVEPEDVDATGGGAPHKTTDEIPRERSRTDEEAATQRNSQRCRAARADGPDALPRAFDAAPNGPFEAAAARDLETGEAGLVEDARKLEDARPLHPRRERLLREEPDGRIYERGHGVRLRPRDIPAFARVDLDPVTHVHEQRHLDYGPGFERCRLRHVGDGVALDAGLGLDHGKLH
jgi:hypothetical protein